MRDVSYNKLNSILTSEIPNTSNVLDFGCGTGTLLAHLQAGSKVGYDPSKEMIKLAREKYPEISFVNKLPDQKFDFIYSVDVIEHVEDLNKFLDQLENTLDDNGTIILIFANPFWEPFLLLMEKLKLKMPEGKHHRFLNGTVKKELTKVGLKDNKIDYYMPSIRKVGLIEVWNITKLKDQ